MAIIETRALRKRYPAPPMRRRPGARPSGGTAPSEVVALDGLDLTVGAGECFGILGPNGAGKTTTIGILTTRVRASGGRATVAGFDVSTQDVEVRRRIGVVPQRPNPDRSLNVLENLVFHGTYFGVSRHESDRRAMALLDRLGIADKADAKTDDLSGGQAQRLMIARALLHEPDVIFLDEPTVGLDPQARHQLWELLQGLHRDGRTIVMTTHYMEEADRLCDRLAIIDRGTLLACDTPAGLKAKAPGATLIDLTLDGPAEDAATRGRTVAGIVRTDVTGNDLRAYSDRGGEPIPALIRAAEESGRVVQNINLQKPSLETLFISLTGRKLEA
ncbi:MAG: ABC transporter ATP-binding protein [Gemmatimonadaceae bacterium]|nr:ABC transporter ATP-binding protein [Gemmatimonadaceae bacterium]